MSVFAFHRPQISFKHDKFNQNFVFIPYHTINMKRNIEIHVAVKNIHKSYVNCMFLGEKKFKISWYGKKLSEIFLYFITIVHGIT